MSQRCIACDHGTTAHLVCQGAAVLLPIAIALLIVFAFIGVIVTTLPSSPPTAHRTRAVRPHPSLHPRPVTAPTAALHPSVLVQVGFFFSSVLLQRVAQRHVHLLQASALL